LAITSSNWFLAWIAIEINLIRFIPVITRAKTNQETEACIKYFLAQAVGSALMLLSRMSFWSTRIIYFWWFPILTISLLLKLGAVPCHFWFPSVMTSLSWTNALLLATWQKLAPLALLSFPLIGLKSSESLFALVAGLNALVGGLLGINQSHIRTLLAYSSITHIGWIISALCISNPFLTIVYFSLYIVVITPIFIFLHNFSISRSTQLLNLITSSKFSLLAFSVLLISLAGLPPLTGFLPKWLLISSLIYIGKIVVIPLLLGSYINLYFYLNLTFNRMLSFRTVRPLINYIPTKFPVLILPATSILGVIPLFIYAMTILHKS
jgi:NADH:ubiquinone oxidoreductase subunit 2 (subunit N)